ncbi:hypothetical protein [Marinoscillum pacificum]|uniref:hypothetical protein n=1 Tax=Marinoscillum pacificum TaxID=392723 RepID=UPI002157ED73|nr:hypothetical protein [Marinoscillum pacificum]
MTNQTWIPKILPIMREEDYHTHYISTTKNKTQFFGYQTFVFPDGFPGSDWKKSRKEYVILHLFDDQGNHIKTEHWFAGTTDQINPEELAHKLHEMINELEEVTFQDIAVVPFSTEVDGIQFGLIPNDDDESISLQPSSTIAFYAPWDGEYYT